MFNLQVILIMEIVLFVQSGVLVQEDQEQHLHSCTRENNYLTGLVISDPTKPVRELKCSRPPTEWDGRDTLDEYPKWITGHWLICSNGYFLNGFYRPSNVKEQKWDITRMTRVRCVKPASHPVHYGDCFTQRLPQDVNYVVDCRLKGKFFMVGVHATVRNVNAGIVMNSFRCCTMAQKPYDIHNFEQLQERIMATKLKSMAELADGLGYMYCVGVKGLYSGDDYRHAGNHWTAEESDTYEACDYQSCTQRRLHILYDDWKLVVKNITYGQGYTDSVHTETIDSGTLYNYNPKAEVTESVEITNIIQNVLSHSTTSSQSDGNEISVALEFALPYFGTISPSLKKTFQLSDSRTNQTLRLWQEIDKKITQRTLKPLTASRFNVTVSKSRTVIPYTATVIATFTVRFEGMLRGALEFGEEYTNFHHLYHKESEHKSLSYTFGDRNIPFYRALKKESELMSEPWLWKEMKRQRPNVSETIEDLIDERSYESYITGNVQYVSETNTDFVWEEVYLRQKQKSDTGRRKSKKPSRG